MAHRWVVRKSAKTLKSEDIAHLVKSTEVLRGLPAMCGAYLKEMEFWEKAEKKTRVCRTCKEHLRPR
jgi:hypothetical protein